MKFTRDKEIGRGTYGVIHSGEIKYKDERRERGAMKQIFHFNNIAGIGVFREIQILQTLSSRCIHFPKLLGVFFDTFKDKSRSKCIKKEEYLTFATELLSFSGESAFGKVKCNIHTLVDMASQLICAVAFMHSKFITHRDIKPANILLSFDPKGKPLLKLCDFGLSQFLSSSARSTPGTNSPWYRAPEICWKTPKYGANSDVWAVGVTIYEMLTGMVLTGTEVSDDQTLFYRILEVNPNQWTEDVHTLYKMSSSAHFLINGSNASTTLPPGQILMNKFRSSVYYRDIDHSIWVKFEEILKKCLNYNFSERISCWALLSDPIFDSVRPHIDEVKSELIRTRIHEIINFSVPLDINTVKVSILENFIQKTRGAVPIRHMFHAADLANRVFSSKEFDTENEKPALVTTACIYFFHKYFAVMTIPDDIDHFFEGINGYSFGKLRSIEKEIDTLKLEYENLKVDSVKSMGNEEYQIALIGMNNKLADLDAQRLDLEIPFHQLCRWIYDFELKMLKVLFSTFHVFRPGVYEMSEEYGQVLTHDTAMILFSNFIRMSEWNGNTFRFMYRHLYHKYINPTYNFVPFSQMLQKNLVVV